MKINLLFTCFTFICPIVNAQSSIEWQRAYGSTGNDKFHGIVQTQDGNYVVMGIADSMNGDVGCQLFGLHDEWVIKMDAEGNIIWETCLGGSKEEEQPHNRIIATSDGGFLTAGETWSSDYLSTGNHGQCDVLLVKLSSEGEVEWTKVLGGQDRDTPRYLYELPGQQYLLLARTLSKNGDIPPNTFSSYNAVVFKLNKNGKILSTHLYGGSGKDELWAVTHTNNKLIYAGHTSSPELGTVDTSGWLLITDANGAIISSSVYGDAVDQRFLDLIPVNNNEVIACGETGDPSDFWAVKLNLNGNVLWNKTFGGSNREIFKSATKLNKGICLTGGTTSFGNGKKDGYLVKINQSGNKVWELSLGGSGMDWVNQITRDGYLCGYAGSDDGDVTGYHGGPCDGWIVKITQGEVLKNTTEQMENVYSGTSGSDVAVYPNPFLTELTISFTIVAESFGTIDLLDLRGNPIYRISEGHWKEGTHSVSVLKNELPAGLYFVKLAINDAVTIKKIVID